MCVCVSLCVCVCCSHHVCVLQEAKQHMKRCIESGLWVPNARADEEAEKEPQDEEVKNEEQ